MYQAKIVELKENGKGLYYPIYEYQDDTGKTNRVTSASAFIVNPWDLNVTHKITVNEHGAFDYREMKGCMLAIVIVIAFFVIGIVGPFMKESFMGLILVAMSMIPVFLIGNTLHKLLRRKMQSQILHPTKGKVVWYKETTSNNRHSSHVHHYPIIEYSYAGHTLTAALPDKEIPIHIGEQREFYIDIAHKDVFTKESCRLGGQIVGLIIAAIVSLPFLCMSIALTFPGFASVISEFISNNLSFNGMGNEPMPQKIMYRVLPCFFLLCLIVQVVKEFAKLSEIQKAKRDGQSVYAAYTKTNDYGRHKVRVYEYTYMGQARQYQSKYADDGNIELYIHPKSGVAYSKFDTQSVTKDLIMNGIGCVFVLFAIFCLGK